MPQGKIDFANLFRRALERAREQFEASAPAPGADPCQELLALPDAERRCWLATNPVAEDPRFVQRLFEQSFTTGSEDPPRALALAELGLQAAEAWSRGSPLRLMAADLQAEAWMYLANARRVNEDYEAAEGAWERVAALLPLGTGQALLACEVPEFQGALRRAQRRFLESEDLLREAITRYQQILEDGHLTGRARLGLAGTYLAAGRAAEALQATCEASATVDPSREPRQVVGVYQNVTLCLSDLGRKRDAVCLLRAARPLYELLAGPIFRLRAIWLEGRLYAGLKDWLLAAASFETVRRAFLERKMPYDAALVSLDLALVWAENRDFRRVALLASEMYPVFLSQEIPREAAATLLLFADAARERRATLQSIAGTVAELQALGRRGSERAGAAAPSPG